MLTHDYVLFALIGLLGLPAVAADGAYKLVQLPHRIAIEIPAHWDVLSEDNRKNLAASSKAAQKNAGIELAVTYKNLLAVDAVPRPAGAFIRVGISTPLQFTQTDLSKAGPDDLKSIEQIMLDRYKKEGASSGAAIKMWPVQIEPFNAKYRALVIRYEQERANGSSPWQVTQYKIPVDNRLIELTLSSRQSDAGLWQPILERVKRSVRF